MKLGYFDPDHHLIQRPDTVLAWVKPTDDDTPGNRIEALEHQVRSLQRKVRRLQDELNRIRKYIPGATRVWKLHEIAVFIEADAENAQDPDAMRSDALFLERLAYDIETLRQVDGRGVRGGGNAKYDPSQWPRGPRP